MADADEVECWASMADAFDFGDAGETARDASACTVPVPVLERVEHAAAASGTESLESLATRFASEFRSKSPCVTRRAAAQWMSGSRIGRGGGKLSSGRKARRVTCRWCCSRSQKMEGRFSGGDRSANAGLGSPHTRRGLAFAEVTSRARPRARPRPPIGVTSERRSAPSSARTSTFEPRGHSSGVKTNALSMTRGETRRPAHSHPKRPACGALRVAASRPRTSTCATGF